MIQAYLEGEVKKSKAHLEEMKILSDAKQIKLEAEMKESKAHLDAFNLKMQEELAGKNEEVERVFLEAGGAGRGVAGHAGEAARDGGRAEGQPAGG